MTVAIVVAAFAVMAVAAIVGTGRLGEWQEPVGDAPKGTMPEGDVDADFIAALVTPRAVYGYAPDEVDAVYEALAHDAFPSDDPQFTIRRGGYRMEFVDEVMRRAAATRSGRIASAGDTPVAPSDRMDHSTTKE
jgi:hypothetical protein